MPKAIIVEQRQLVSDFIAQAGYSIKYYQHRRINTGETNYLMHELKHGKVALVVVELPASLNQPRQRRFATTLRQVSPRRRPSFYISARRARRPSLLTDTHSGAPAF